jgi:hypothetical protein
VAIPTNSFTTYSAVGNREDLSDMIWKISPTETPFFSAVEKITAKAIKHEWQTVQIDSTNSSNAQLEGDDVAIDAANITVRLGNIHQISRKSASVTGSQEAVKHAGRADELGYQKMLKGQALKVDVDAILSGTNQAANAGNATTARTVASLNSWLKTNTNKGAAGADPASADSTGTRTDGTQRAFTEAQLKDVLQKAYIQGGKPHLILVGPFNKQQFSTFTGRSSPIEQAASKKIVAAVDAYESDFGKLKVVPSRNIRPRDVYVLETEKWAVSHLPGRSMVAFDLAKTGDTMRAAMVTEYSLESRNEKASGMVADVTVT